jgi:hypothetical protein
VDNCGNGRLTQTRFGEDLKLEGCVVGEGQMAEQACGDPYRVALWMEAGLTKHKYRVLICNMPHLLRRKKRMQLEGKKAREEEDE